MKHRMSWTVVVTSLVLFSAAPLFATGQIRELPDLKLTDRVGQSALYQSGKVRVLLLQGTPYQIGYAHGKLLARQAAQVTERALLVCRAADSAGKANFFADTIEHAYQRTLPYVPARYREELRGLADGSGLDLHKVELANLFPELFHCSGFAFMGKATKGGTLIHGRVLDYMTQIGLQDQAVVTVIRSPGTHDLMLAGYAGFIGCVTGLNDAHISIGEMGMGGGGNWDGEPMTFLVRQMLEEYDSLAAIRQCFIRTRKTCEYAYVVADAKVPAALGVHARFDGAEFLEPGQFHKLLDHPLPECILISAGDRYAYLARKAKELYGRLDIESTIELIKRPLAMESNLHDAIMIPAGNIMYLADAAAPDQKNFQACYQPYYKHDLGRYAAMLTDLAKRYEPTKPATVVLTTTRPAKPSPATQPAARVSGTIPAALHRPIPPAAEPRLAGFLKRFDVPAADVPYQMMPLSQVDAYRVWQVTFPSPFKSTDPENNTVWCEYFQSKCTGRRPAVIVLHFLQNEFTVPRIVCHMLASAGMDALLVKMAYYGERRPKDPARQRELMADMDTLLGGITQSVVDIRRAAEFLAAQPDVDRSNIGVCGISLGALVGSLAVGVDGHFPHAALVLGGGDLVRMIQAHSREVRQINEYMKKNNIDSEKLRQMLEPIEPLTYIDRAAKGGTRFLLLNVRDDTIIPPECTQALAQRLPGARTLWYDGDHTAMIWHIVDAVAKIQSFFQEKQPPTPAATAVPAPAPTDRTP